MKIGIVLFILGLSTGVFAQSGVVKGRVFNSANNEPIEFAKVQLVGLQKGGFSDDLGEFFIENLDPGVYSFQATVDGFEPLVINDITVTNARSVELNFAMISTIVQEEDNVTVVAKPFVDSKESPVSLKTLNATEIERLPGANRDASRVLQALPGVASPASFRNDIIIRGGAPSENKFYLDGIEVPNINHFATQGSSGGPVGLLNVNFIREVDFYSGAFPANYANGLSSVISFKQKDGNKDALLANVAVGSSDIALTLDGPLGKKGDFIFSVRRSYLQLLFAALKLPFLPTYNDSQFKVNYEINKKNKITVIGLGALDDFVLNSSVNDGVDDPEQRELNDFFLGNIPTQDQWNYTIGVNYLHYGKSGFQRIVLSRNMLKNKSQKFFNNIETDANRLLDYSSFEAENKLRLENTWIKNGFRVTSGLGYEYARYYNSTYNKVVVNGAPVEVDFESNLFISKIAGFAQVSKSLFKKKLDVSAGLRTDISTYSASLANPLNQLSPMLSLSYKINSQWALSANVARFHQLPSYTVLGFRDQAGNLVNKDNNLKYIRADHYVAGASFLSEFKAKFSIEGFWKNYSQYPFSINDSISLANVGSDFGIVGNEEVTSSSEGRAYGLEFLYQQKLVKGFYGILAYTFVNSEFLTKDGNYAPSSWDSKHIVSLTAGKRFKKGWELGFRWLFSGGAPYTPIDVATSSLQQVWDVNGQGLPDYDQLNQARGTDYHQLNIRLDKRFDLKKMSLQLYLDIQNAYAYQTTLAPILLLERDENGNPLIDPNDPARYQTKLIDNTSGILQPSIGIIFEFKVKSMQKEE
ncbi:MAG: TonB-dependent receptor [Crocinitomicaceae bacterium]|nr:TonB-dependent receptor [Crocinitomicaceae bacterium]